MLYKNKLKLKILSLWLVVLGNTMWIIKGLFFINKQISSNYFQIELVILSAIISTIICWVIAPRLPKNII